MSRHNLDISGVRIHLDTAEAVKNQRKYSCVVTGSFFKGADIHLKPQEEKHLAHEASHAVQQRDERVKPTFK